MRWRLGFVGVVRPMPCRAVSVPRACWVLHRRVGWLFVGAPVGRRPCSRVGLFFVVLLLISLRATAVGFCFCSCVFVGFTSIVPRRLVPAFLVDCVLKWSHRAVCSGAWFHLNRAMSFCF